MTETTRAKSAKKPADHKPATEASQTVEFGGIKFQATRKSLESLVTIDLLERGMINTALRRIVGDKNYDLFLKKNPDADAETAGELLEAIGDKVGAKN